MTNLTKDYAECGAEEISSALNPFAKIADLYDGREDDSFEIWKDCHERETRVTLGQCRAARTALLAADRIRDAQGGDRAWHPIDGAPQDETVFLAALWHNDVPSPRWEYALLWWSEGRLRFYDNETGWDTSEYTHFKLIDAPSPTPPPPEQRERSAEGDAGDLLRRAREDLSVIKNRYSLNKGHVNRIHKTIVAIDEVLATNPATPSPATGERPDEGHPHLIGGEFQSDKYPTCPRGKVPLSVKDATAQDLLWEYAQRRRAVDAEFADDLEIALKDKGYVYQPCGTVDDAIAVLEKLVSRAKRTLSENSGLSHAKSVAGVAAINFYREAISEIRKAVPPNPTGERDAVLEEIVAWIANERQGYVDYKARIILDEKTLWQIDQCIAVCHRFEREIAALQSRPTESAPTCKQSLQVAPPDEAYREMQAKPSHTTPHS